MTDEQGESENLDPFAGSGTAGSLARGLGRSSILIEIKEQYVELMKKRVDCAHKALDSFGRVPTVGTLR